MLLIICEFFVEMVFSWNVLWFCRNLLKLFINNFIVSIITNFSLQLQCCCFYCKAKLLSCMHCSYNMVYKQKVTTIENMKTVFNYYTYFFVQYVKIFIKFQCETIHNYLNSFLYYIQWVCAVVQLLEQNIEGFSLVIIVIEHFTIIARTKLQ